MFLKPSVAGGRPDAAMSLMLVWFCAQELCKKGAELLEAKSARVEEAANELISMLLELEDEDDELESEDEEQITKEEDKKDDDGFERKNSSKSRGGSSRPGSRGSRLGSAAVSPAAAGAKRKREMRDYLEEEAQELLTHFSLRNIEAIVARHEVDFGLYAPAGPGDQRITPLSGVEFQASYERSACAFAFV